MGMYPKTILRGTIFKARQKIIMKSRKHDTVSNRNENLTLAVRLAARSPGPRASETPPLADGHTWIPRTACFMFSRRALFSGL